MPLSRSEQARVNGAKSHGPKTSQGKARSSQNAIKHGRYSTNAIVLQIEDNEAFEELVGNYVEVILPANTVEHHLTRELAAIDWLLTRVYALDTRLLDHEMEVQAPASGSAGIQMEDLTRVTVAGRSIVDRSNYPDYLARRAAQLIRARQSTLAFLKDLRKNFPMVHASSQIIPPEPLNAEFPYPIEPDSNQPGRGVSPEPASAAIPSPTPSSASVRGGAALRAARALQRPHTGLPCRAESRPHQPPSELLACSPTEAGFERSNPIEALPSTTVARAFRAAPLPVDHRAHWPSPRSGGVSRNAALVDPPIEETVHVVHAPGPKLRYGVRHLAIHPRHVFVDGLPCQGESSTPKDRRQVRDHFRFSYSSSASPGSLRRSDSARHNYLLSPGTRWQKPQRPGCAVA